MPRTWLSFEVLATENKLEISENACLTRIECRLIIKRPKNRLDTLVDNKPDTPPDKHVFADLFMGNVKFITSL